MNGLLLVDKPEGVTSHDVVSRVRKILQTKEVGHSGTLDPMASGLMVLLIGEATKLSSFVTDGDKSYQLQLRLGVTTDTLDITGKVLSEKPVHSTYEEVLREARKLNGEFELPVPLYSAKKIEGKKLYEYAREAIEIERPVKLMKFWDVQPQQVDQALEFKLSCSKGSFIRSWVQLLGEKLGCGATLSSLRRTSSHMYNLKNSITLDDLEKLSQNEKENLLVPLDEALVGVKKIRVKGQDAILMKNGQISHQLRVQLITQFQPDKDQIIQVLPETKGQLLAIIGLEKEQGFKIKRVFNC